MTKEINMNDAEFQKLLKAPSPIVLQASWRESLFVFHSLCSLTLDASGFSIRTPWSKRYYVWKEMEKFVDIAAYATSSYTVRHKVLFYKKSSAKASFLKVVIIGMFSYLPFNCGLSSAQLAQLMNHWRERALKQN